MVSMHRRLTRLELETLRQICRFADATEDFHQEGSV